MKPRQKTKAKSACSGEQPKSFPSSLNAFLIRASSGLVHLGSEALNLLKDLPSEGLLFPYLASVRSGDRATEFRSRCRQLKIQGVSLHSYRYAWAERARTAGYPERFAQEALGHNSKAVHRAYAKRALVKIPSLEEYEKKAGENFPASVSV